MSTEMKPWQQGVPMETLKPLAEVFKREYKPYIFGAFGLPKERDIATAIAETKHKSIRRRLLLFAIKRTFPLQQKLRFPFRAILTTTRKRGRCSKSTA